MDDARPPSVVPPPSVRGTGAASIVAGVTLALLNVWLLGAAAAQLRAATITVPLERPLRALRLGAEVVVGVGLLLIVSGIGLRLGRRWGRTLGLVAATTTFLGLFVAAALPTATRLARPFPARPYEVSTWWPALMPLWGIALLVLLNLTDVRAWARGLRPDEAEAVVPTRRSVLAMTSFILSLIPLLLLPQLVALVLGAAALRSTAAARGQLGGHSFAVAAVMISSGILTLVGGITVVLMMWPGR